VKQYDIKGVVTRPNTPSLQFTLTVNANDQASAKRLIELQYGFGGAKVTIQKIQEVKPKK
jgi:ribosomal protein L20A (L18A)